MNQDELKDRTKQFALRAIRLGDALSRKMAADVIGRQLIRSATSVAANYRSACRAKSRADFISKMGTVEEEADESACWLDVAGAHGLVALEKLEPLLREADQLTAMMFSTRKTLQLRTEKSKTDNPKSKIR